MFDFGKPIEPHKPPEVGKGERWDYRRGLPPIRDKEYNRKLVMKYIREHFCSSRKE